jgi:general L-amino acid transport system substrate-binding protein
MGRMALIMAIAGVAIAAAPPVEAGATLDAVRARGQLVCGVAADVQGFAQVDAQGKWSGLGVDLCRATATAIFGDAQKVKIIPLDPAKRFPALQAGEVDLLASNSTFTLTRDAGVDFAGIYYYDGQGFLVARKLNKRNAKELNGITICLQGGTTAEANVADYFQKNKMTYKMKPFDRAEDMRKAFFADQCDALTADLSNLYATRLAYAPNPNDYLVVPQAISKEPLALVVRHGDHQFADIVRWSLFAMIEAEEYNITSRNVDQAMTMDNPLLKRLLGVTPGMGKALGVDEKWFYNIIKQVGNYGECYDRNIGVNSVLKIPRGLNTQWTQGGMLYAPPIR